MSIRGALCAGLGIAAVGCAGAASVLPPDYASAAPSRGLGRVLTVLLVLALLARVVVRPGRRRWMSAGIVAVVGAVLVGTGLDGLRQQFREGFPGRLPLVFLVAGGCALVAVALGVGLGVGLRLGRPRPVPIAVAVVLGVAVPAIAVPLAGLMRDATVSATTVAAVAVPAVPAAVTKQAWSTSFDDQLDAVVSAGAGVVVSAGGQITALDGTSGARRWTYRRTGADLAHVNASRDGSVVFAQYSASREVGLSVVGLDALTGRVRLTLSSDVVGFSFGDEPTTNASVLGFSDGTYTAYSLLDGLALWRYSAPAGCSLLDPTYLSVTAPAGLLVGLGCGRHDASAPDVLRYDLLDGRTGRRVWTYSVTIPAAPAIALSVQRYSPKDGRYINVIYSVDSSGQYKGFDLDTATGRLESSPQYLDSIGDGGLYRKDTPGLYDVATGALTVAIVPAGCATRPSGAVLSAGVACAVLNDDNSAEVQTASRTATSLATVPVELGGPFILGTAREPGPALQLVSAPGAVVVWNTQRPETHHSSTVVGLR